jgi:tetratricopeptide (TPR) repeat protein
VKTLINFLILSTLLVSCAHNKGIKNIDEIALDGLRFESLNRYSFNNLKNVNKSKINIASCHKGDYNKATESFKSTLDNNQNNPVYWNQLATCYLLKDKLSQAKFYFDLALKTSKTKKIKTLIYNNIGVYFMKLKMYQEALASFSTANKYSKKYLTPKYNMAQIYLKFGHYNKAKPILIKLLQKENKDIDFLNSLAHLNLMTGKYKQANQLYSRIPVKYITRDDISTNYAMSLYMLGNYKKALAILKASRMEQPFYELSQNNLISKIENVLK